MSMNKRKNVQASSTEERQMKRPMRINGHELSIENLARPKHNPGIKQKTRREDRDDDKRRRKNRALTRKGDKLDGAFAHGSPDGSTTECTRGTEEHTEHRKEPKPLPFRKEFFKRQKKLAERRAQREEAKRRRDESMKARALKRKLVMQRSRRGQPIIQNLMQSILAKLGHKSH